MSAQQDLQVDHQPEPERHDEAHARTCTTDAPPSAAAQVVRTSRDRQQEEAFTQWYNRYSGADNQADSVITGLRTGVGLLTLLSTLGSTPLRKRYFERPRNDLQCLDNLQVAMDYMIESEKIKLVGIGAKNVFDGDRTRVLGLVYTLIVKYEVHRYGRDVRDLLRWMQNHCVAYAHLLGCQRPHNFTTDMRDGIALAGVLHSHFPDLIDIDAMQRCDGDAAAAILANNGRVSVALERIGVPRMIEPAAMVDAAPDEKTQIAVVSVMRHALEQERERRETERLRLQREHATALQLAKQKAEAEEARHHRLALQQQDEKARAIEESAAAAARIEAKEAAAAVEAELTAREEQEIARQAVAAEESAARKAAEQAQLESELALRARAAEGCWLYKQSPKSYSTFFKRWFVYSEASTGKGQLHYYKDRSLKNGKTVDLSEIVDVRLEFDDPTLVLGGRSTLLNFQLTDNKNNIVYRLSAEEEEGSAGADLESRAPDPISDGSLVQRQSTSGDRLVGTNCVDMWLSILRHHALADDAPRTEHSEPPTGSVHLPERIATQEKVAVLRHVMSPSALRKVAGETLSESDTSVDAEAQELNGPGEVEDGVEWEDVTDGVYLLIEHTQTKREGHTFKFRLRVTARDKRVDFQIDFGGSINMNFTGKGIMATGSPLCRVEVRGGETKEVCVCRTVDPKKKANLSYETAVAEYLLAADDSDDG